MITMLLSKHYKQHMVSKVIRTTIANTFISTVYRAYELIIDNNKIFPPHSSLSR